jgi:hypothetical protein
VYVCTEVEALGRYRGFFVGSHRVREVDLPEDRTVTLREHYRGIDRVLDRLVPRIGTPGVRRLRPTRALAIGAVTASWNP